MPARLAAAYVSEPACAGMDALQASLPSFSPEYATTLLVLFGVYLVLMLFAGVFFWRMRKSLRFVKVRPFTLAVFYIVASTLTVARGTIGIALEWPCSVLVSMQFFAAIALSMVYAVRVRPYCV
jgi:heme A synthase